MAKKEKLKADIELLLRDAKDRQAALEALTFLFPKLGGILDVPTTQYAEAPGRSPRRSISRAEFARTYFSLTPDEVVWGKSQADALAVGEPKEAFDIYLSRVAEASLQDRAKLRRLFVDLLSSITRQTDRPVDWFMALLENARTLVEHVSNADLGFFDLEVGSQITFLLADILKPLDEATRSEIFSFAVRDATDISFLCSLFRSFAGDLEPEGARGFSKSAFGENTDTLRNLLVARVIEIADSLELYAQTKPEDILWFWWGAGHGEEVRRHTAKAMENPAALLSLMEIAINTVHSTAGNYERVNRRSWSKIVNLEELHRRAVAISTRQVEPASNTARRFLSAYERDDEDDF